jgi:D-sedoheptulose 7-phosphate isomerase
MLLQRIQQQFIDSADLKYQCAQSLAPQVEAATQAVLASVTGGGKILTCGNGASASAAQHFSASFVGRYERERPELAALCLSADAAVLTGIATDFDTRQVFSRQVRALGHAGDVLLVLSTSGNSANVLAAVEAAHEREMTVVALTGGGADSCFRSCGTPMCTSVSRMRCRPVCSKCTTWSCIASATVWTPSCWVCPIP